MKIIGITGNVASGKNTIADIFLRISSNAIVFDADVEAQKLLDDKKIIAEISAVISGDIIENNCINRQKLGKIVFSDKDKLQKLENIIHPEIAILREKFLQKANKEKRDFAILNIPLLFEKNLHKICDKTILVICDELIRKQRFLLRAKQNNLPYDEGDFYNKLNNQMADEKKVKFADFIIENNINLDSIFQKMQEIVKKL